jgi:hypothetical protein
LPGKGGIVPIWISDHVRKKLAEKHQVTEEEVRECFMNVEGEYLRDRREEHRTDPPTFWFIAETDRRRLLKICFVSRKMPTPDGYVIRTDIKSAFPPDYEALAIWDRHGKR